MNVFKKVDADVRVTPNLRDYAEARKSSSWSKARGELDGLPNGAGLNMAYEAVDRHVAAGKGNRVALRWLGKSGGRREITFEALSLQADFSKLASIDGRIEYVSTSKATPA